MIGQKNLISKINSLNKLPHSIILYGERGSEQDEVCNYIANKFNLLEFDLTESISTEFINEIYSSTTPTLYTVKLSKIAIREQNILLKLYEEPTDYTYIILLAENDEQAIETLKTRSYSLKCDLYNSQDLLQLVKCKSLDETQLILQIVHTPGQVELANHTDMKSLYSLCNAIIDSMKNAAFMNTLSISNKINFKDEYEKYDLYMFILTLNYTVLTRACDNNVSYIHKALIEVDKYIWSMINKQMYFENFLITIWRQSKLV